MKAWINDKEFEFQEGETILHAAKRLGISRTTLWRYLNPQKAAQPKK